MPLPVAGEIHRLAALHCQRDYAAHLVAIRDATLSPFLLRMHPNIGRKLRLLRELNHANRRRIARRPTGSTFQRGLYFPSRRISRPTDVGGRQARPGLAAMALDLEPAQPAVDALADCRRRLRGPATAFHP